jgi:hypothetical protein
MDAINSRTRVVYFRLTEAEFESCNTFCRDQGLRSMSELARLALHSLLDGQTAHSRSGLNERVGTLNSLLAQLSESVRVLTELLARRETGAAETRVNLPS